ncbi:unnamed protein product [Gordionus sp. m RMFG-2023]|uniref:uncharacterized protein LOC135926139 n=1 Tax=Gordionus sp. m RMFG-2023 TaxID=3053472 RepID=UPI0030DECE3A
MWKKILFFHIHWYYSILTKSHLHADKVTLLDTTKESNLNWVHYRPNSDPSETNRGWLEESYSHEENGALVNWRSYVVCDMNDPTAHASTRDNWLRTPMINIKSPFNNMVESKENDVLDKKDKQMANKFLEGVRRVHIDLTYSMRDCSNYLENEQNTSNDGEECKETFEVYYSLTDKIANVNSDKTTTHKKQAPSKEKMAANIKLNQMGGDLKWTLLDRVASYYPDDGFENFGPESKVKISRRTLSFNLDVSKWRSFYLAFHDSGACLSLLAVRVYILYCPGGIINGAWLEPTPTGPELTSVVPAKGVCLPHSTYRSALNFQNYGNSNDNLVDINKRKILDMNIKAVSDNLFQMPLSTGFLCKSDGKWFHNDLLADAKAGAGSNDDAMVNYNKSCLCDPGYQQTMTVLKIRDIENSNGIIPEVCENCPTNTYKHSHGNYPCTPCPGNSNSPRPGSVNCLCEKGFFRPESIFYADTNCQKPPPKAKDFIADSVEPFKVTLTWKTDLEFDDLDIGETYIEGKKNNIAKTQKGMDNVGRIPVTYRVACDICDYNVGYLPRQNDLNESRVEVINLIPGIIYNFVVYSENIISKLAGYSNYASLAITTKNYISDEVKDIQLIHATSRSILVKWNHFAYDNENQKLNDGNLTRSYYYELICSPVTDTSALNKSRTVRTETGYRNITISDLKPSTEYNLKVRVKAIDSMGKFCEPFYFKTEPGNLNEDSTDQVGNLVLQNSLLSSFKTSPLLNDNNQNLKLNTFNDKNSNDQMSGMDYENNLNNNLNSQEFMNLHKQQMGLIIGGIMILLLTFVCIVAFTTFFLKRKEQSCKGKTSSDCDSLEVRTGPEVMTPLFPPSFFKPGFGTTKMLDTRSYASNMINQALNNSSQLQSRNNAYIPGVIYNTNATLINEKGLEKYGLFYGQLNCSNVLNPIIPTLTTDSNFDNNQKNFTILSNNNINSLNRSNHNKKRLFNNLVASTNTLTFLRQNNENLQKHNMLMQQQQQRFRPVSGFLIGEGDLANLHTYEEPHTLNHKIDSYDEAAKNALDYSKQKITNEGGNHYFANPQPTENDDPFLIEEMKNMPIIDQNSILVDSQVLIGRGGFTNVYRAIMCFKNDASTNSTKSRTKKSPSSKKRKKIEGSSLVLEDSKICEPPNEKYPQNSSIPCKRTHQEAPNESLVTVAIKKLENPADRIKFLRTATMLARLRRQNGKDNINIVKFFGIMNPDALDPCILMEFVENGTLETFLKAKEYQLTRPQLLSMCKDVCNGMKYLYKTLTYANYDSNNQKECFVHRRLRAAAILVDKALNCKISGLCANITHKSEQKMDYEMKGDFEGIYNTNFGKIPIRWTAPETLNSSNIEILNNNELFNETTDIWSFGVLCWEIFSLGDKPYWSNWSNRDVIKALTEKLYRLPPPMYCPEIVHEIMLYCWHNDPSKRPTFKQLLSIFRNLELDEGQSHILDVPAFIKLNNLDPFGKQAFSSIEDWLNSIKLGRYSQHFESLNLHSIEQLLNFTSKSHSANLGNQQIYLENFQNIYDTNNIPNSLGSLLDALNITNQTHRNKIYISLETLRYPYPPPNSINSLLSYDSNLTLLLDNVLLINNQNSINLSSSGNSDHPNSLKTDKIKSNILISELYPNENTKYRGGGAHINLTMTLNSSGSNDDCNKEEFRQNEIKHGTTHLLRDRNMKTNFLTEKCDKTVKSPQIISQINHNNNIINAYPNYYAKSSLLLMPENTDSATNSLQQAKLTVLRNDNALQNHNHINKNLVANGFLV